MLARLIYAADERVYPKDSKFRDIAKAVFVDRKLWDPSIILTAPDIGGEFRRLKDAPPAELAAAVLRHAEELGIPIGAGARLLDPRIVTTFRKVDREGKGPQAPVMEITENYLEYAYEIVQLQADPTGAVVAIAFYGGGTLVMDDKWKAQLLCTSPERQDAAADNAGTLRAIERDRRRFLRANRSAIQPNLADRDRAKTLLDPPVMHGCPLLLMKSPKGAYRLVRRACSYGEHVKNIRFMQFGKK